MNYYIKKILIFTFIVLQPFCYAYADKELTIVRGQDFPPYHYVDKNGVEQGFVIETVKGAAQLLDTKISYKQYPWSRCIYMMKNGQADAMINLFKTEEREAFMHFSETVLGYETNSLFTLTASDLLYSGDLETLIPHKMGTIRNYSYGKQFDAAEFPLKYQFDTEKDLINGLINNRCSIIVGNRLTIQILYKKMRLENKIKPLSPDISKDPLYIGFSKKRDHEALSKSFSEKLKQFKVTTKYKSMMQKYSLTSP